MHWLSLHFVDERAEKEYSLQAFRSTYIITIFAFCSFALLFLLLAVWSPAEQPACLFAFLFCACFACRRALLQIGRWSSL